MHSFTEENYLKAIYKLQETNGEVVATSALAQVMGVHSPSVTDMLKRMASKKLVIYQKSKGFKLTEKGRQVAVGIVRKHRLWETFLYEKFEFTWDEVHEVAEQLEHIHSPKLIEKLDKFLDYPEFDPHGDAIPNAKGELKFQVRKNLSQVAVGKTCKLIAVKDNTASFLQYVVKVGLGLSSKIKVVSRQEFDGTMEIEVNGKKSSVSQKFAENLYVI